MACPNASAPLNIVASDKTCNSKCAYSFQYPISNMIISNKGEYLKLNTEVLTNLPPVQYRQSGYLLQEGRLYVPSIHTYGAENETAPAELILIHTSVTSSNTLLVCVPIKRTPNSGSDAATLLDLLINEAKKSANAEGQQTTLSITKQSLDAFIPLKKFSSYKGTLPFNEHCESKVHYIVFALEDAAEISVEAYSFLNKRGVGSLIRKHKFQVVAPEKNPGGLFKSTNAAQKLSRTKGGSDDIFIDCQPTGADGEVLVPNNKTSAQMFETDTLRRVLENGLFQSLIGVILMVGILTVGKAMLKKLSAPSKAVGVA